MNGFSPRRLPGQTVYSKALALFVALSVLLGTAVVWLTQAIITGEFRQTEVREMAASVDRLKDLLSREVQGTDSTLAGWVNRSAGGLGVDNGLLPDSEQLALLGLDFAAIFGSDGTLLADSVISRIQSRRGDLSSTFRRAGFAIAETSLEVDAKGGFGSAGSTLVAMAWRRVPGQDRVILGGRMVDGETLTFLESILPGSITFRPLMNEVIGPPGTEDLLHMMETGDTVVSEPRENEISAMTLLDGLEGNFLGILTLTQWRAVDPSGEGAVQIFLTFLVLAGGVLFVAVWFLLDWTILRRIRALTSEVEACRTIGRLPVKLAFKGKDELGQLARRIEDLAGLLQTVQSEYRAVVEDQTEVICRFSEDFIISFANAVFARAFTRDGVIPRTLKEALPPAAFEFLMRRFMRLYPNSPIDTFHHEVPTADGHRAWFRSTLRRNYDAAGNAVGGQWVAADVTAQVEAEHELQDSERQLRALSGRLMHLQDEERRRIARELHDSTAQSLSALEMNVSLLGPLARDDRTRRIVSETREIARNCCQELRNISYLLHPPLLDEVGLAFATRWFVDGFTQRTGIAAELDVPEDFPRLQPDVETALFRVIQEAASNIYRHSGAKRAEVALWIDAARAVRLRIQDNGRGFPPRAEEANSPKPNIGIGMAGMRERILQLGGNLTIENSPEGVTISIVIPPQRAYVGKI